MHEVAPVAVNHVTSDVVPGGLGAFDFGLGTELLDGIDEEERERYGVCH
jgi:hypothetical protein